MKMSKIVAVSGLTLVVALSMARVSAQSGYDLFQMALATERADVNLKNAIALYHRVVTEFPGDRSLSVNALIRMAECYQKLGDVEARTIYERIVREFPDRKEEVALARARLGGTAAVASSKGDRPVWTGPSCTRRWEKRSPRSS